MSREGTFWRVFWSPLIVVAGFFLAIVPFVPWVRITLEQPFVAYVDNTLQLYASVTAPDWALHMIFWGFFSLCLYLLARVSLLFFIFYIYRKNHYFEEVEFGKPNRETILRAADGILNARKVEPFYVHAAPKFREAGDIVDSLIRSGFAVISGRPGEGKSMGAYHAAYELLKNRTGYRIYRSTQDLKGTSENDLDDVFLEIETLRGKSRLIIVDDTHNLLVEKNLREKLQFEAGEGNLQYIWVENVLLGDTEDSTNGEDRWIRINFQGFLENLIQGFYQSEDPLLRKALEGRVGGLAEAEDKAEQGKIVDVWQFAFCATEGKRWLDQEILALEKNKDLELLVLFLISAYTVLSSEQELHENDVRNWVYNLHLGWLKDELMGKAPVEGAIRELQKRKLIKIYDRSMSDRGYIVSLHYNFARQIVAASLSREHLADDLVASLRILLNDEYRTCIYVGVLQRDLNRYARRFVRQNKAWLVGFISNPLADKIHNYSFLLSTTTIQIKA